MVYITHDQSEAMALADRIAVMEKGKIAQLASPRDLYREPATALVGAFVGHGAIVPVEVISADGCGAAEVILAGARLTLRCRPGQPIGAAQACLRPEHCEATAPGAVGTVAARVVRATYRGGASEIQAELVAAPGVTLRLDLPDAHALRVGEAFSVIVRDGWVIPTA